MQNGKCDELNANCVMSNEEWKMCNLDAKWKMRNVRWGTSMAMTFGKLEVDFEK